MYVAKDGLKMNWFFLFILQRGEGQERGGETSRICAECGARQGA